MARIDRQLPSDPHEVTVAEIVVAFRKHAREYYRLPDGTMTSEVAAFDIAVRPLVALYARTPATQFGPLSLAAVRTKMITLGWCRTSINKHIGRIKRLFKWAVANELIPASVHHGLITVEGLRAGRSDAIESDPVRPVPITYVEAILPHVSRQVATMIRASQ